MADVTGKPRHRLRKLRSRTIAIIAAWAAVLFLVGSVLYAQLGRDTAKSETQATAAQAQDLAAQIQAACKNQSLAGPVCERAAQVAAQPIPGPVGPQGDTGPQGPAGPVGPQGPTGAPGPDGPAGPAGAAGINGADGAGGSPGQNGQPGEPGPQGPVGPTGHDGSPAASYTLTFPDGSTQTCTRSGGPDTAPEYLCAAPVPAPLIGP